MSEVANAFLIIGQAFVVWILVVSAISHAGQVLCKQVGTLILLGCRQYFEAKKQFLVDVSKMDIPDLDEVHKWKHN